MNTTEIKPVASAANWLKIDEFNGFLALRRVNESSEILQSVTIFPEEIMVLADLLSKQGREAA